MEDGDKPERTPIWEQDVHGHELNGLNDHLSIMADGPGPGNASHRYRIVGGGENQDSWVTELRFQKGPIGEAGVNGISNEALLAIVRHRLLGFQSGPYSCRNNAIALTHVEDALHWLLARTRERSNRGVEGSSTV